MFNFKLGLSDAQISSIVNGEPAEGMPDQASTLYPNNPNPEPGDLQNQIVAARTEIAALNLRLDALIATLGLESHNL